jgi:hypothetical protein
LISNQMIHPLFFFLSAAYSFPINDVVESFSPCPSPLDSITGLGFIPSTENIEISPIEGPLDLGESLGIPNMLQ